MWWLLRRLIPALGVFALSFGLGYLAEGSILKGAALVAIGVPLVVLPAARFVRDVVRSGADGAALGL